MLKDSKGTLHEWHSPRRRAGQGGRSASGQALPAETLKRLRALAQHVKTLTSAARPSVLLLGLGKRSTLLLYRPFAELGWDVMPQENTSTALTLLPRSQIDLVVLEVGQDAQYAPLLIRGIRAAEPHARRSKIALLGPNMPPRLMDQLFDAGVDMILPGPGA